MESNRNISRRRRVQLSNASTVVVGLQRMPAHRPPRLGESTMNIPITVFEGQFFFLTFTTIIKRIPIV